jgi:secreted trypsin-like serine protease
MNSSAIYNGWLPSTGIPQVGKDSFQGDFGGPIIDSNGAQIGIVSWVGMYNDAVM